MRRQLCPRSRGHQRSWTRDLPGHRENLLLLLTQHLPDRVWQRLSRLRLLLPSTVEMLVPESRGQSRQEGPGPGHVPRSGARGSDCDGLRPSSLGYHTACSCCVQTGAALPRSPGPPGHGERPLPRQPLPGGGSGYAPGGHACPAGAVSLRVCRRQGPLRQDGRGGGTPPPPTPAPFHCTYPGTPDPLWSRPGGATAPAPLGSRAL